MAGVSAAVYETPGAERFVIRMGRDNDDGARWRFPFRSGGELRLPVAVGSPCPRGVDHAGAWRRNSIVIEHGVESGCFELEQQVSRMRCLA
jgi:hypothetical protein